MDIFNKRKVEHLQVFDGKEELTNDFSPKIPITEDYYEEILKTTEIFKKEKELVLKEGVINQKQLYSKVNSRHLEVKAAVLSTDD